MVYPAFIPGYSGGPATVSHRLPYTHELCNSNSVDNYSIFVNDEDAARKVCRDGPRLGTVLDIMGKNWVAMVPEKLNNRPEKDANRVPLKRGRLSRILACFGRNVLRETVGCGMAMRISEDNRERDERTNRFRELLLDFSAKLISIPHFRLGEEIDKALECIGEFWGLQWIALAEESPDGMEMRVVHDYRRPEIPELTVEDLFRNMPSLFEMFRPGDTPFLSWLPQNLPDHASREKAYWAKTGLQSVLLMPIKVGPSARIGLSVVFFSPAGPLTDGIAEELRGAGEVLASALERKKAAERIDELMRFEHLLSEISATYINLPVGDIEKVMRNDLGRLCRFLGGDRCILYLAEEDKRSFKYGLPFIWWADDDTDFLIDENGARVPISEQTVDAIDFAGDLQWVFEKWSRGESFQFTHVEELPKEAEKMRRFYIRWNVKSYMSIPVSVGGSVVGALVVTTIHTHRKWPEDLIPRVRLFGEVFANAVMRRRHELAIKDALSEIKTLKERFEADYHYLDEEIKLEHNFGEVVGKSDALKKILIKAKQVAPTNATVLILGETGTGKGVIARAIHNISNRKERPLMQVNCATLTPTLVESELFGHEKGAFTGAATRRQGRFEAANGTTLFLDEIGELSLELQAKLLRVLQDGEFERVGGSHTIKTDVRVIAATNKDLAKEVEEGRFRRDLWYRLSIFPIFVPPLRERPEDIPLFVDSFVAKYGRWMGKHFEVIPERVMRALQSYSWPGNIRELENIIERAVITSPDGTLQIEDMPGQQAEMPELQQTDADPEREEVLRILEEANWTIEGPRGAARRLGLKPSTLRSRMQKLDIQRPASF